MGATGELDPARRRGRGAVSNETGRFERETREVFHDGWGGADELPPFKTEVFEDVARRVITRNTSPDLPFDRSINPYRGCEHGCVYCFARPSHAYLGLSPGLDFETKLFAKPDAPERLAAELSAPNYRPRPIAIGANTDPYQPIERERRLMRRILEVLREFRHPVTIVTKGALIMRDADILGEMAAAGLARAALSVTTLDPALARAMEPRASAPHRRLRAIETLSAAGVPMGVMAAPLIPSLNDHELDAILEAAARAGASWANYVALRLPLEVAPLFEEWLKEARPDRAARVMKAVRQLHGGRVYDAEWGKRLRGEGVYAELIARRMASAQKRLGLDTKLSPLRMDLFQPPRAPDPQLALDLG